MIGEAGGNAPSRRGASSGGAGVAPLAREKGATKSG